MERNREKELREIAQAELGDPMITIALLEHQIDMITMLALELAEGQKLSDQGEIVRDALKQLMRFASIDIENIDHPYQSYKIPRMTREKMHTRYIQQMYLNAKLNEGLL